MVLSCCRDRAGLADEAQCRPRRARASRRPSGTRHRRWTGQTASTSRRRRSTSQDAGHRQLRRGHGDSASGRDALDPALEAAGARRGSRRDPQRRPTEMQGEGVLFPALVIGLGQMGLPVLQRLRESLAAPLRLPGPAAPPAPAAARHRPRRRAAGDGRPAGRRPGPAATCCWRR